MSIDSADEEDLSSSELIVRDLMQGIFEGRYAPGQRLVEADLTRQYGVSRGSVREALNRMSADGVVTLERHRGAFLRSLSRDEALEDLALLEVLTGLAARLAAERVGDDDNALRIKTALDAALAFESTSVDPAYSAARNAFFTLLTEVAGNPKLGRIRANLRLCLVAGMARQQGESLDSTRATDFRRIAEAVLAGDGDRAERAARRHIRRVADLLRNHPARVVMIRRR